jgi:two-component system, cell cycle response regulator
LESLVNAVGQTLPFNASIGRAGTSSGVSRHAGMCAISPSCRITLFRTHFMLKRLTNALRSPGRKPLTHKTTEVHRDTSGSNDVVGRSNTHEPALIVIEGDLPGQVFRLREGRQLVGRRPECDIRLRERAVSGVHAEVVRIREQVSVNDLASTNGTLINGLRIEKPSPLVQGSVLKVGNCVFRYVESLLEVEFTEALHTRGTTDQLTGLHNKLYLLSRLAFTIDTACEERQVGVISFDYDDFKLVNDRYGHAAGDHVLRVTCSMIADRFVRSSDLFARVGGEEFVMILPETPLETALATAEAIRHTLETRTFHFNEKAIRLTASFGVCSALDPFEKAEALLERADELLYRSKREGRNRISC